MDHQDWRHFADYGAKTEIQLTFPFMADDPGRDLNAPDELALRIVRSIFDDPTHQTRQGGNVKIISTGRDHHPPSGITERRAVARDRSTTIAALPSAGDTLRHAMRPRVDMTALRQQALPVVPLSIAERQLSGWSPASKVVITLLMGLIYVQALWYPEKTRVGWDAIGRGIANAKTIVHKIETEGIKGTSSYRPAPRG